LGPKRDKFGTGMFYFMARFGVFEVLSGWFRVPFLVCTQTHAGNVKISRVSSSYSDNSPRIFY